MKSRSFLLGLLVMGLVGITLVHRHLGPKQVQTADNPSYKLAFLPVTCHLTCPVTDYINKASGRPGPFQPQRFGGWPELKESFLAGETPAAFLLAPMAIALREQGVKLRVVYLGHRDGTAMMVHKDSGIDRIEDLKGKKVAFPNRFSNQFLLLHKALTERGMSLKDVEMLELPPPDMPVALQTRSVDAVTSGEPFMARTELDGYGKVLYLTKDVWPNFISCVLVVQESLLEKDRPAVETLVAGIASSGLWLDSHPAHRDQAAEFVGKKYNNQNPALLRYVLSKPPDRVRYTNLALLKPDFLEIERLGKEAGLLKGTVTFEDYTDTSLAPRTPQAWNWEASR